MQQNLIIVKRKINVFCYLYFLQNTRFFAFFDKNLFFFAKNRHFSRKYEWESKSEKRTEKIKSVFRNRKHHKNIKITMIFSQKSSRKTSNAKALHPIHFYFHFTKIEKRCAKQYCFEQNSPKERFFHKDWDKTYVFVIKLLNSLVVAISGL